MKIRFKTKCLDAFVNKTEHYHVIHIEEDETNIGMFGSKIIESQFEKIESVLSKRYIKLPFGIRLLI